MWYWLWGVAIVAMGLGLIRRGDERYGWVIWGSGVVIIVANRVGWGCGWWGC